MQKICKNLAGFSFFGFYFFPSNHKKDYKKRKSKKKKTLDSKKVKNKFTFKECANLLLVQNIRQSNVLKFLIKIKI